MIVQRLNDDHDRKGFDCGDELLNTWFARTARQHRDKGLSSTFVAVENASDTEVLGFYALNFLELINSDLPAHIGKKLPEKVPVFRLGRLASSAAHRDKHVGRFLLFDAIERVTVASKNVGGIGLVVNAKPSAVGFYTRYGFEAVADQPGNLIMLI